MYLVGLVTGIVALPLVALGPERVLPLLPDSWLRTLGTVLDAVYYPLLVVILVVALTTLYKVALPLKPPWHRGLPGALLAALVFLLGSSGLRLYLDWLTNTGYTYGALAAPIAFLLATFFIGLAIILGAHLNAAIQEFWPVPLSDRRGRLARSGPGTAALRRAIRENPDAAAAVLEQLAYTVESPAGRRMARDRQEERVARDQQDGAGDHK
jgi:membrane protein